MHTTVVMRHGGEDNRGAHVRFINAPGRVERGGTLCRISSGRPEGHFANFVNVGTLAL